MFKHFTYTLSSSSPESAAPRSRCNCTCSVCTDRKYAGTVAVAACSALSISALDSRADEPLSASAAEESTGIEESSLWPRLLRSEGRLNVVLPQFCEAAAEAATADSDSSASLCAKTMRVYADAQLISENMKP